MREVKVVPPNPEWASQFKSEAARLAKALGANAVAIHHIGSTAIPDIYAKPIIDVLIEVSDLSSVDARIAEMEALGYESMGEFGLEGRRYFRKDDAAGIRTHHVHAFGEGSSAAARHIAFRDFMIAHPDYAQQYSDLKQQLASVCDNDIEKYMDGKDAFIKQAEQEAIAWYAQRKRRENGG